MPALGPKVYEGYLHWDRGFWDSKKLVLGT